MPGITAIENPRECTSIDEILRAVCFDDRYRRHEIVGDTDMFVGYTGYESYPVDVFEADEYTAAFEGYLYGTDAVEETIDDAATYIIDGEHEKLRQWIDGRDGDFLLLVADRTSGKLWVLNDVFGRLPTYRATVGETTVVSRELKVIRELARRLDVNLEADRLGVSQTLLFRYSLGTRTLFEGVERLPPGSLLDVETGAITALYKHRFDWFENRSHSTGENVRRLTELFLEACANRASVADETVVALSGGLDSRAVVAGYDHVTDRLSAATSAMKANDEGKEVTVARKVAKALDTDWNFYSVERSDRHLDDVLDFTQGMNNVWIANGLHFAELVADDHTHHTAMLVTGDGGDKAIPDLTCPRSVATTGELVTAIIDELSYFPIDTVSELTGIPEREIVASVRERVDSYPETNLDQKYAHFLVRERGINWLNHGEDRTRYHLWSTTPFYSTPFFFEAMACPPKQKRGTSLYREFLTGLSSTAVEIDYADFDAPITSFEYRAKRYAYNWLGDYPKLKNGVVALLKGRNNRSPGTRDVVRSITDVNKDHLGKDSVISKRQLGHLLNDDEEYSDDQLHLLLTILHAIADDRVVTRTTEPIL
ncbi:hypothetical protein A4G99_00675 [Haladaptatus sp. R4]|uniref:asparagine synthase-related protein n=1 Tax=Haladaptatus sp. R4 TaxID=1679489 RepID=UPI0007B48327|nr:asparagine synthase-related protein [Haladaptatus sp. R4]KZN25086.1 hypothetical protein A4G99_00675 [Haladaptatus sp. R4]